MKRLFVSLWVVIACCVSAAAWAQTYPDYENTTVNDFADLMDAGAEAALAQRLQDLRDERGVEMTVLTLNTQSAYAPDQSLEDFATGLFNAWGIGNASRNDGILVMVIVDDRAMRIELGRGYPREWDAVAARVIDTSFLGYFADGDYQTGIEVGSDAVINQIAIPFHENREAPGTDTGDRWNLWVFVVMAVTFIGATMRQKIGDLIARLRKCPQCGQRTLKQTRRVTLKPTAADNGLGKKTIRCTNCGYEEDSTYYIKATSRSSRSGFGGGSSRGGGASGRW